MCGNVRDRANVVMARVSERPQCAGAVREIVRKFHFRFTNVIRLLISSPPSDGTVPRFGLAGMGLYPVRVQERREMESYKYEVTVRRVHPGEWVYRDNVLFPRENEEYAFDCDVYRIDEYGRRTHEGTWMNSGSKRQMVDYLASKGFDYAPRKRVYR